MEFKYCRFHALFHDDMDVVRLNDEGQIEYRWHHIDKIYDFLLSIGMRPFVELNPMPSVIASGTQTMFWYEMNVTPPKSMDLWYDLIHSFTEHITERYGMEEVSQWFFEVWNEPNLECFWSGDKQQYFELYTAAAEAVKSVCSEYKVGGPATAVAEWVGDIIDYCTENNVPLDFVSTHIYPQDEYCRFQDRVGSPYPVGYYYEGIVKGVEQEVLNSKRPDIDIYWTEYNTLSTDCSKNITFLNNTALDRLYGASCVVRNMVSAMGHCESISYWTVSDIFEEAQMRHTPFSGTYGLITIHGIRKATYNAFILMRQMKGEIYNVEETEFPLGCGILASEENGIYHLLLWNCNIPEMKEPFVWKDSIVLDNISENSAENYMVLQAKIEKSQGSAYEAWLEVGKPANLTSFQERYLKGCSEMKYSVVDLQRDRKVSFNLQPDEVCYMQIHKKFDASDGKTVNEELEQQLFTH